MILYYILLFFGVRAAQLLWRNQIVTTLGINLSDPSYDSGSESAEFVATLNAAKDSLESGDTNTTIIDSGGNSDGDWIELLDGTLVSWGEYETAIINVDNSIGALYRSATITIPFPRTFTSSPIVPALDCYIEAGTTSAPYWANLKGPGSPISDTSFDCEILGALSRTSDIYFIQWMAIGAV